MITYETKSIVGGLYDKIEKSFKMNILLISWFEWWRLLNMIMIRVHSFSFYFMKILDEESYFKIQDPWSKIYDPFK
jgi:hypothetical protein